MITILHKKINKVLEGVNDAASGTHRLLGKTEDGFARLDRVDAGHPFENCTKPVLTMYGIVNPQDIIECVENAKGYIKSLSPALNTIIGNCNIVYTGHTKTMATDGYTIFINPGFVKKLDDDTGNADKAVAYILLHEALHILFDHVEQYNTQSNEFSSHDKANAAMDCEVNWFIEHYIKEGMNNYIFKDWHELLNGWWNQECGEKGWLWEKIYKKITLPKTEKSPIKPMSDEWKRGFLEGYKSVCRDLRSRKLIY